jgi:sugar lactone lactonase YvrE
LLKVVAVDAAQSSCPAFGGAELTDLYVTSAAVGLKDAARAKHPGTGQTFVISGAGQGRPEPQVVL